MVDRRLPRSFFVPLQTFATSKRPFSFLSRASKGWLLPFFSFAAPLARGGTRKILGKKRKKGGDNLVGGDGFASPPFLAYDQASFVILYAMLLEMVFEIVPG